MKLGGITPQAALILQAETPDSPHMKWWLGLKEVPVREVFVNGRFRMTEQQT